MASVTVDQIYSALTSNPISQKLHSLYQSFHERRSALDLHYPGQIDHLSKEVERDVFLNNQAFTGFRADFTKSLGVSPLFQISHSMALGSQQQGMPPYNYSVLYGSPQVFLQANADSDLSLNARFNRRISDSLVAKFQAQMPHDKSLPGMFQAEADYSGADFSANLKATNPSVLEGVFTGMYACSYFQSLTSRLSLGLETLYQRPEKAQGPDMMIFYACRYKTPTWIASARLLGSGGIQTAFWKKLADRVEAGAELQVSAAGIGPMGGEPDGLATVGVKYDFRTSSYRAQIDSKGKLSCLLEKAVAPPVRITFAGEIDHMKQQAKIGLAVSVEAAEPEVMQAQEKMVEVAPPPF